MSKEDNTSWRKRVVAATLAAGTLAPAACGDPDRDPESPPPSPCPPASAEPFPTPETAGHPVEEASKRMHERVRCNLERTFENVADKLTEEQDKEPSRGR